MNLDAGVEGGGDDNALGELRAELRRDRQAILGVETVLMLTAEGQNV